MEPEQQYELRPYVRRELERSIEVIEKAKKQAGKYPVRRASIERELVHIARLAGGALLATHDKGKACQEIDQFLDRVRDAVESE